MFFKACLNDGILESHTKIANLPDNQPAAFAFVMGMIHDKLTKFHIKPKTLTSAYVVADKIGIEPVMNLLLDSSVKKDDVVGFPAMHAILNGDFGDLPSNCPLREHFIVSLAWKLRHEDDLNAASWVNRSWGRNSEDCPNAGR